jgi:hypothetical protein
MVLGINKVNSSLFFFFVSLRAGRALVSGAERGQGEGERTRVWCLLVSWWWWRWGLWWGAGGMARRRRSRGVCAFRLPPLSQQLILPQNKGGPRLELSVMRDDLPPWPASNTPPPTPPPLLIARVAPEILMSQPCTQSVDIFSFGMLLWEIVTGARHVSPAPAFLFCRCSCLACWAPCSGRQSRRALLQ